jgi:hypothetical protein
MSWASRRSQRDCVFAGRSHESLSVGLANRWPARLRHRLIGWAVRLSEFRPQRSCAVGEPDGGLVEIFPTPQLFLFPRLRRKRGKGRGVSGAVLSSPSFSPSGRAGWGLQHESQTVELEGCSTIRSIGVAPTAISKEPRGCRPRRESHRRANSTDEFQVRRGHVNPTRKRGVSLSTIRLCVVLGADKRVRVGPMNQRAESRVAAVECRDFCENDPLGRRQVFEPTRNSGWNLNLRLNRTIRSFDREFRTSSGF